MKLEEFKLLLADNRQEALRTLFTHWVSEWMNDGEEEIVRVLTLWAERADLDAIMDGPRPSLLLGNDDDIVELAKLRDMFD